jgi:phosphoserine phosphatase RsbU/P
MQEPTESPIRILIVEDNPVNVKVLMSSLEPLGHRLLVAPTGTRGLSIAQRVLPELVLLDVNLPELSGFEVCEALTKDPKTAHIPIIFLSALDDAQSKVKGLSLGAVDYITKPFYKEEVVKRVETQLKLHQLTEDLKEKKRELERKNDKLITALHVLNQLQSNTEQSYRRMADSIEYAQRIQYALLPEMTEFARHFADTFIFYRAKAVVSGDLYWSAFIDGSVVLAALDCTGHGVPGAFMSVIGHTQLNQVLIEQRILDPGRALNALDARVHHIVNRHHHPGEERAVDGMDIALCIIDREQHHVRFAGANLWLVRVSPGSEPEEFKGDKLTIGGLEGGHKEFHTQIIPYAPGDWFYLFTDGIGDQFGGTMGKKLTRVKVREKLRSLSLLTGTNQAAELEAFFDTWRGTHDQVDDVTVIGFRPQ